MKKIVLLLALLVATLTVSAENILYFTYNQASRTVPFLNNQNELMIYCGYPDELPTYVLVNEVWAEQISSSFYEIWLYGFDAYTGEEVYMPIDLGCIWLVNRGSIYSAAQALRIRSTHVRPTFAWAMPPYNPFVRRVRPVTFYYTYHYDIHRPGWRYDLYPSMHYHPYYLRRPSMPAPMPPVPYTPGREYPGYHVNNNGTYTYTSQPLMGNITACRSQITVQNNPTGRSGNTITSNRSDNTIITTDRSTGRSTTATAPTRSADNSRGVTSRNTDNSRSSATEGRSSSTSRSSATESRTPSSSRSSATESRTPSTSRSSATESRTPSTSRSSATEGRTPSTSRSAATESRSSNTPTTATEGRNNSSSRSSATETPSSSNSRATTRSSRSSRATSTDNSGSSNAVSSSSRDSKRSSERSSSSRTASTR